MNPTYNNVPRSNESPTNSAQARELFKARKQEESIDKIFRTLNISQMLEHNNASIRVLNKEDLQANIEKCKEQNSHDLPHVVAVLRSKDKSHKNCRIVSALTLNFKKLQETKDIFFYVTYDYEEKKDFEYLTRPLEKKDFEDLTRSREIEDRTYFIETFLQASKGDAIAQFNLGICYQIGKGTQANLWEAINWFKRSADQNDSYAKVSLARIYLYENNSTKEYPKAFELLKAASISKNIEADTYLAECYEYGKGTIKNLDKAIDHYQMAANSNFSNAQYKLGKLLVSEKKDYTAGAYWLAKASKNPHAQYELGCLYFYGLGKETDEKKAKKLWKLAANQGVEAAKIALAELKN